MNEALDAIGKIIDERFSENTKMMAKILSMHSQKTTILTLDWMRRYVLRMVEYYDPNDNPAYEAGWKDACRVLARVLQQKMESETEQTRTVNHD